MPILGKTDRHINVDEVNGLAISTVIIAANWYETMVFAFYPGTRNLDFSGVYSEVYSTEEAARKGHDRIVKMAKRSSIKDYVKK